MQQGEFQDINDHLAKLEAQANRMGLLNEMSQQISLALTEDEVFRIAAQYTSKIFKADRSGIGLLNDTGEKIEVFALTGTSGKMPIGTPFVTLDTVVGVAIQESRLIVTSDTRTSHFADLQRVAEMGLLSAMNTPLITGGKVIGTLNLACKEVNAYGEGDQTLFLQTAAILAANIQNRRLVSQLQKAFVKSEELLTNILPISIADRMKNGEHTIADRFETVSILFADIVGFTELSSKVSPEKLVKMLDTIFSAFDALTVKYNVEKIKTIGDCYMVVSGVPAYRKDHLDILASMALEMCEALKQLQTSLGKLQIRIGLHSGEVVAGVIGKRKFAYDLWGDAVNTASRMESHGEPGKIHCSEIVYEMIKNQFLFEERGKIFVKSKGEMQTYFLLGRR